MTSHEEVLDKIMANTCPAIRNGDISIFYYNLHCLEVVIASRRASLPNNFPIAYDVLESKIVEEGKGEETIAEMAKKWC